jgi:hypothetical protein
MPQFVLHVGPHKTGSTYLQDAFALLRPQLAERGILYPSVWGEPAHHMLYEALRSIPNPALEAEFAAVRACGHRLVLISGEGLSVLPPASIAYLRALVGPASAVRVVYYVRSWADLLPSQWKQAVKGGATTTLPEYLCRPLANPQAASSVNFGAALRHLARAFGKEAIRIVAYDEVVAARQDLFSHFAETFLGLPDQPAPRIPPANVSPGTTDIEVIRALLVLEGTVRGGPVPGPFAVTLVARYLRRKPAFEMSALARALASHAASVRIDETAAELAGLHERVFAEFGQCVVPPSLPHCLFRPRRAEVPYVDADYLLVPDVLRELRELHKIVRVGKEPALPGAAPDAVAGPAAAPAGEAQAGAQ